MALDGQLRRSVFVQHSGLTRDMAIGEALPTEAEHPVEHLVGAGLFVALTWLDLDVSGSMAEGPARFPDGGQVAHIRSEHYQRYARPKNEWLPEITVVVRDAPRR